MDIAATMGDGVGAGPWGKSARLAATTHFISTKQRVSRNICMHCLAVKSATSNTKGFCKLARPYGGQKEPAAEAAPYLAATTSGKIRGCRLCMPRGPLARHLQLVSPFRNKRSPFL